MAAGSSSSEPSATRVHTSTGTETPPSATLMSRYGMPQITPIAANSNQPRLLNPAPSRFARTRPRSGPRVVSAYLNEQAITGIRGPGPAGVTHTHPAVRLPA